MRTGIVLLARHASTRFPGKALALLGHRSLLEHCLRRLQLSGIGPVVLATTTRHDDNALVAVANGIGVGVYRGSEQNVLQRMSDAVEAFGFDVAIRATGDNPAVDVEGPARVLRALVADQADYACELGLPVGAAVEAVTRDALLRSAHDVVDDADREHVTTFIKHHPERFRLAWPTAPRELTCPDLRLTVDSPDDLDYLRRLCAVTATDDPSVAQLIAAAGTAAREVA